MQFYNKHEDGLQSLIMRSRLKSKRNFKKIKKMSFERSGLAYAQVADSMPGVQQRNTPCHRSLYYCDLITDQSYSNTVSQVENGAFQNRAITVSISR